MMTPLSHNQLMGTLHGLSVCPYWTSIIVRINRPARLVVGSFCTPYVVPGFRSIQRLVSAASKGTDKAVPSDLSNVVMGWMMTAVPVPNISSMRFSATAASISRHRMGRSATSKSLKLRTSDKTCGGNDIIVSETNFGW